MVPPFPPTPLPPPVDNFFNIHLTKNIINIEDVEFDFIMGCVLVLFPFFMNSKREIYIFRIFEFLIFLFSNIAILDYFDPK